MKIVAPSDAEAACTGCWLPLGAGAGDAAGGVASVTRPGAAGAGAEVVVDGGGAVTGGATFECAVVDGFVAEGLPGDVAVLTGGAGATVSVEVGAVDIDPGVIVPVAVSVAVIVVPVSVIGAAEVVEIVDVVSVVDVVVVCSRLQLAQRRSAQAPRRMVERMEGPFLSIIKG